MIAIGIAGRARSGKDAIAEILVRRFGFVRLAFADPLKDACAAIFGFTKDQLYGDQKEKPDPFWDDTPRKVLQLVGTECLRKGYADDVWVRAMERRVKEHERVVIPDVRYPNEAGAVRRWGGILIRVTRDGAGATGGVAGHPSEHAIDEWDGLDFEIPNNGTLAQLEMTVSFIAEELLANHNK